MENVMSETPNNKSRLHDKYREFEEHELDLKRSFAVQENPFYFSRLPLKHKQFAYQMCEKPHTLREVEALFKEAGLSGYLRFTRQFVGLLTAKEPPNTMVLFLELKE